MVVAKSIQTNYRNVMRSKFYFFRGKSIWLYLMGMLLLGYGLPLPQLNTLVSGIIYFFAFIIVILLPVYHFSARNIVKTDPFDAEVLFNEQNIAIRHKNKELDEVKDWSWIKRMDMTSGTVMLEPNQPERFLIILDREKLTENEWLFFKKIRERKFRQE